MKFSVKYVPDGNITLFGKPAIMYLNFDFQKGIILLNETGLILVGNMPKFKFVGLTTIDRSVLNVQTTRTVPYSTIIEHKPPNFFCCIHKIIYLLPDGEKCAVRFIITKPRKINDRLFTTKLQEYITVAKSLANN